MNQGLLSQMQQLALLYIGTTQISAFLMYLALINND